jgi:branched-chain amino acid transport system ATP-binding protein
MPDDPVLCVNGHFAFGYGNRILAEVDLSSDGLILESGDICAVVGPNGCGKTTLLNVISGLKEASRGSVSGAGIRSQGRRPVFDQLPRSVLTNGELRRSFQVPVVSSELPVQDYAMIGHRDRARETIRSYLGALFQFRANAPNDKSDAREAEDAQSLLRALGFKSTEAIGEELSYGQRRLASFAQALMSGARLLLLDEATANISEKIIEVMKALLRKYVARDSECIGRAILMVEHNDSRIEEILTIRWSLEGGLIRAERLREPWTAA